jgi:FkbM family methyltransferase
MDQVIQALYQIKDAYEKNNPVNLGWSKFVGNCFRMARDSKAQSFQDVLAYTMCGEEQNQSMYFVEFGATNGIDGSNTYMLERNHFWKGLLIEPNPAYHEDLKRNRLSTILTDCIYDETGKEVEFLLTNDPELSTISDYRNSDEHAAARDTLKSQKMKTITLFDLLEREHAPDYIDYISVDTEGSELRILAKFFEQNKSNKYVVKLFTVEHNFVEESRQKIFELMVANGYKRIFTNISRWDDFYIKKDLE